MKPHSLRKTLWFVNLGLLTAVVAVGFWFVTEVRPAVAKVAQRPANKRPPQFEKIRKEYESERQTGLNWTPKPPVSEEDLHKYILIDKFNVTDPKHWIFSGPMPPEKIKQKRAVEQGPVKPKGLETLGKVATVIYSPPDDTVLLFYFKDGKTNRAFGVGDFVRMKSKDKALPQYQITKVEEVGAKSYKIHYAVFAKDMKTPSFEGAMPYGQKAETDWPYHIRPVKLATKAGVADGSADPASAGTTGDGLATPATEGAGDGAAEGSTDGEAGAVPAEAAAEDGPTVIEVARKSPDEITVEDMKPKIIENLDNRNEKAVAFDQNTYDFYRSKNAKSVASTVKTEIAKDKRTGRTLGLRITGLKQGSAAGAFQVKKGDILVSINGRKVESRSDAIRIVEGLDQKNLVTVVIDRHGKLLTYKVDPSDPKTRRQVRYFENQQ